jgi:hypothetical protein
MQPELQAAKLTEPSIDCSKNKKKKPFHKQSTRIIQIDTWARDGERRACKSFRDRFAIVFVSVARLTNKWGRQESSFVRLLIIADC